MLFSVVMGEVYRADDLKLGQPVALKLLPDHLLNDGAALASFHREVRVARQVSHKNVCRVYDIGEVDGRHFLSMEFIKGEELSSLLHRIGRAIRGPLDKRYFSDQSRFGPSNISEAWIFRYTAKGEAAADEQASQRENCKPFALIIPFASIGTAR